MIRVTVYNNRGTYNKITVSGHAGYAEEGEDIVCAAVSALVINTANSLERFTGENISVDENGKKGSIEIRFNAVPGKEGKLLMDSLVYGLEDIKEGSADYIDICYKEG